MKQSIIDFVNMIAHLPTIDYGAHAQLCTLVRTAKRLVEGACEDKPDRIGQARLLLKRWLSSWNGKERPSVTLVKLSEQFLAHTPEKSSIEDSNKDKVCHSIRLGLYRVFWCSGGTSLASVYMDASGAKWFAPTNWVAPALLSGQLECIARMEGVNDAKHTLDSQPVNRVTVMTNNVLDQSKEVARLTAELEALEGSHRECNKMTGVITGLREEVARLTAAQPVTNISNCVVFDSEKTRPSCKLCDLYGKGCTDNSGKTFASHGCRREARFRWPDQDDAPTEVVQPGRTVQENLSKALELLPPWCRPNEHGEWPGDICCERAAGEHCYEHDAANYPGCAGHENEVFKDMVTFTGEALKNVMDSTKRRYPVVNDLEEAAEYIGRLTAELDSYKRAQELSGSQIDALIKEGAEANAKVVELREVNRNITTAVAHKSLRTELEEKSSLLGEAQQRINELLRDLDSVREELVSVKASNARYRTDHWGALHKNSEIVDTLKEREELLERTVKVLLAVNRETDLKLTDDIREHLNTEGGADE